MRREPLVPPIAEMRRRWLTATLIVFGWWIAAADPRRAPSIEQTFVAEAQAAAAADAMCLMPDRGESIEPSRQTQIAIPTATSLSGDMPPLRLVVDPYPSFNGVAVDTANDLVLMSDTNRKSLLLYDRTSGSSSKAATPSLGQIMGPETGIGFIAGVAMDPDHRELFTVNNDVEDRLVVFGYDARGNVKPKRLLYVPHQSWGVSFNKTRGEIALSV